MLSKTFKHIVKNSFNIINYIYTNKIIKNYYIIINFHQVTENFDPLFHWEGTWTNINEFERLLLKLKTNYKIVTLSEGINIIKTSKIKDKLISITFDDGDKSIKNVLPILIKHNIPASFFINTAYISTKNFGYQVLKYLMHKKEIYGSKPESLFNNFKYFRNSRDRVFYEQYRDEFIKLCSTVEENIDLYVDETFLSDLDPAQFELGLHGHHHERYSMMSEEWQERDLKKNIEQLSSYKSYRPIFAIPYGKPWDWNESTIRIALNSKLDILFHDSGFNIKKDVGFKRIPADGKSYKQLFYNSQI